MKLQQYFSYDSTILALNDIYYPIPKSDDSFYINSKYIKTRQNKVVLGDTYCIIWSFPDGGIDLQTVMLMDVYCDNVRINLDVMEFITHKRFTLNFNLREANHCTWSLVDSKFWLDDDELAIEDYCGCK